MYAAISGTLLEKGLDRAIVDTPGGVAYECKIPESERHEFPESGKEIRLFTHLYVREDRMELYGFLHRATRDFFRQLLPQQGVGPKLAMSILSELGSERFRRAIHEQDVEVLTRVKGVGKKTARRLIVEMAEQLPQPAEDGVDMEPSIREEATQALMGLGFNQKEASGAIREAARESDYENVEDLISQSLKFLEAKE